MYSNKTALLPTYQRRKSTFNIPYPLIPKSDVNPSQNILHETTQHLLLLLLLAATAATAITTTTSTIITSLSVSSIISTTTFPIATIFTTISIATIVTSTTITTTSSISSLLKNKFCNVKKLQKINKNYRTKKSSQSQTRKAVVRGRNKIVWSKTATK